MNKNCEKLDMFVSYEMNLGEVSKGILQIILGRMENAETEEEFNTCKELVDDALLNLIADNLISQEDFVNVLELLEQCTFEEEYTEDEGLDFTKTTTDEAHGALKGGKLHLIQDTFHEDDSPSGVHLTFQFVQEDRMFYRDLYISNDGTIYISKEY